MPSAIRSARGLFIAGTDTEIGKTHAAVSVIRTLVASGLRVGAMKPVAAGAEPAPGGLRNADALALAAAANVPAPYERVNPYCLIPPVSPHIAAQDAGICIEMSLIERAFGELALGADCVVVEGAGGWYAPIGDRETMADVALALKLPVLLVVGLRLGCLSHALLTAHAIEASGLAFAGWIGNHIDPRYARLAQNVATLERLLGRPAIALIPHGRPPGDLGAAAGRALAERLGPPRVGRRRGNV